MTWVASLKNQCMLTLFFSFYLFYFLISSFTIVFFKKGLYCFFLFYISFSQSHNLSREFDQLIQVGSTLIIGLHVYHVNSD